jgi:hypothetical protein
MVDIVTPGQVSSEYFGFPCQFSFHRVLHTHLSSGAGIIGQIVADVPNGLRLSPPYEIIIKKECSKLGSEWFEIRSVHRKS